MSTFGLGLGKGGSCLFICLNRFGTYWFRYEIMKHYTKKGHETGSIQICDRPSWGWICTNYRQKVIGGYDGGRV